MKGMFDANGHLSDQGLMLLISGEPDEMTRYEMAEHLDYCDRCVDRYSLLLTDGALLAPPGEMAEEAMAGIRRRNFMVLTGRIVKVCAAACLTVVIWSGQLFGGHGFLTPPEHPDPLEERPSFSRIVSGVSERLGDWINGFSIYGRGEEHESE